MGQLAADMWQQVMDAVIRDESATPRERELATLCSELIVEGQNSIRIQAWLGKRAQLASKGDTA